ncbi:MAG: cytochrome c peroxidase [Gemmatimonadales bacterium]
MRTQVARFLPQGVLFCLVLSACADSPISPASRSRTASAPVVSVSRRGDVSRLGQAIFNDQNLSLLRNQSCASCHDEAWGFSAPDVAVNGGGSVMPGSVHSRFGTRKPPSAAYATQSPVLFFDDVDGTYVGGNFWDGRATGERLGSPAAEQSQAPFLNAVEQALPDRACVVYRIAKGAYTNLYIAAYGPTITRISFPSNTNTLCEQENVTVPLTPAARAQVDEEYDRIARSIAVFEASPAVNQFDSKHDAVLRGAATFTPREALGFALFVGKAGCAGCHPNAGERALLTDYTYDNIGVPANPANPEYANNPGFLDLGIGGFRGEPGEWGKEKVPTLRNLDKRGVPGGAKSFMHNGVFKSLRMVVHFYNTRDVLPRCTVVRNPQMGKNCWPAPEVRENVNRDELGNLGLTPDEEDAVVQYLMTLSDGYSQSGTIASR